MALQCSQGMGFVPKCSESAVERQCTSLTALLLLPFCSKVCTLPNVPRPMSFPFVAGADFKWTSHLPPQGRVALMARVSPSGFPTLEQAVEGYGHKSIFLRKLNIPHIRPAHVPPGPMHLIIPIKYSRIQKGNYKKRHGLSKCFIQAVPV